MRVVGLQLQNYRVFENLKWEFEDENLVTLIGNNGAGKSAILDAIAIGLRIVGNALLNGNVGSRTAKDLVDSDITYGASVCEVTVYFRSASGQNFSTVATKEAGAKNPRFEISDTSFLHEFKVSLRLQEKVKLPILLSFGVDRTHSYRGNGRKARKPYNKALYTFVDPFFNSQPPFDAFQEWFIAEDTIEIQRKVNKKDFSFELESLSTIRKAISTVFGQLKNEKIDSIEVYRENDGIEEGIGETELEAYLIVKKGTAKLRVESLSSGEKGVLLLAAEIARRLCLANRYGGILEGAGVVLIDEVELHLHPAWQRGVLLALRKTFPNLQFIVTTHSPQTLSTVTTDELIIAENGSLFTPTTDPKGRDTNGILEELMGVDKRPEEVDDLIDEIMEILYAERPDFAEVESKVKALRPLVAISDPILLRIDSVLRRRKALA